MHRIPEPFATVVELILFQEKVKQYFLDNDATNISFNDLGYVKVDNLKKKVYGITNIAQKCALTPEEKWDDIIKNHFDNFESIPSETEDYIERAKDFANIKDDLRLQLYPARYLEGIDEELIHQLVYRIDIPGTLSMIVIDLPSALQSIRRSDLETWNVAEDEVFTIALANSLNSTEVKRGILESDGAMSLLYFDGESLLTSVQVFNEEITKGMDEENGMLVSIPTRHVVLLYPVENTSVLNAVSVMGSMTTELNLAGPGSLSPLIYWYRNKSFTVLPYSIEDGKFNFIPPQEFIDVLNTLK
jgi:hypothetical protein